MAPAAHRLTLLAIAAVSYALITVAFITLERPGLGLGHLYYVPIVLIALASGPLLGGLAGVLAAVLYNVGIVINPHIPSTLEVEQTVIRLVIYTAVGVLVGFFARRNRSLLAQMSQLAEPRLGDRACRTRERSRQRSSAGCRSQIPSRCSSATSTSFVATNVNGTGARRRRPASPGRPAGRAQARRRRRGTRRR